MTSMLLPRHTVAKPGTAATPPKKSPAWANGSRDPLGPILGPKLGLAPQYVEKLLRLAPRLIAEAILELQAAKNERRIAHMLAPIDRARHERTIAPLCETDWQLADEADAREQTAQDAFHRDPSPENRARFIRSAKEEIRRQQAIVDALEAELV